MEPLDTFCNVIRTSLNGDETAEELDRLIRAAWIQAGNSEPLLDADVARLIDQLATDDTSNVAAPTLLVDWGQELPRIGHQARPQFMLLCPNGYWQRPDIDVVVDESLDSNQPSLRRPEAESQGLWEFFVPFGLTTDGTDCRPGHYLLELKVQFPVLDDRHLPRFFHCTIRLHVPRADESGERELVIDGDGQSMVNLSGHDLKSFSRVVLKGGDKAIINLQQGLLPEANSEEDQSAAPPSITHSYRLKVDLSRAEHVPYRSTTFATGERLESAMLEFDSQKRWLLLPKRTAIWKWSFGRNRGNDVITRFLPRNENNDSDTAKLSRRHLEIELTDEGLRFHAHSSSGVCLDQETVCSDKLLCNDDAGLHTLELGDPLGTPFGLDLHLFTQPESHFDRQKQELQNTLRHETLDEPLRQLVHAHKSGIDTILLTRTDELEHQEAYVLLCQHVSIGNSETFSSVAIENDDGIQKDHARIYYARRSFWIENRTCDPSLVLIDDTPLPPLELAALRCGMELTFGSTLSVFNRPAQLHL